MNSGRIMKVGLALMIVIGLFFAWVKISNRPAKFDELRFQEDVAKIEKMYSVNQEKLHRIVQAFGDNADILALNVNTLEDNAVELWLKNGKCESFEDDYPQLYTDAHSLLETDFKWLGFSRYNGPNDLIEWHVSHERYGPYWTTFYLYFGNGGAPKIEGEEYRQLLSDDCILITRRYD